MDKNLFSGNKIFVKKGINHIAVSLSEVILFYSERKTVHVVLSDGTRYLLDHTLLALDLKLDPHFFFRISRQAIINSAYLRSFKTVMKDKVEVSLRGPLEKDLVLLVSAKRVSAFRKWAQEL